MALQDANIHVAGCVPQADSAIPTSRSQQLAVRAERDAGDPISVAAQRFSDHFSRYHVPYLDISLAAICIYDVLAKCRRQGFTVWTESNAADTANQVLKGISVPGLMHFV